MAGTREKLTATCRNCGDSIGSHRRRPDGTRGTCTLPAYPGQVPKTGRLEPECPCPGFVADLGAVGAMAEGARAADVAYTRRSFARTNLASEGE